jgi:epoxyqueuosine reductase
MTTTDAHPLAGQIKAKAAELGFDRVGITAASASRYGDYLRQWLDDGQAGTMEYLADRFNERTNPSAYFPQAASIICVAVNYFVPLQPVPADEKSYQGKIARYALADDYHDGLKSRLHQLADYVRWLAPQSETRCCTDTAPVMEKELAARAGIGWIGKNTCIINEQIGSWLFLGEVLTSLPLPADQPAIDRCGTCRRCIDACPTQAITEPYKLDARKCISYLTIEHRQEIDPQLAENFGNWIYGCDICQDVCPWNSKAIPSLQPDLQPRFPTGTLDLRQILGWKPPDYQQNLRGSAMKRVKLPLLQRNAKIAMDNSKAKK